MGDFHGTSLETRVRGGETFSVAQAASTVAITPELGTNSIELWRLEPAEMTKKLAIDGCAPLSLRLRSTATFIVVGCQNGRTHTFDVVANKTVLTLGDELHGAASAIAVDEDSGLIAVGYSDGWIRAWAGDGIDQARFQGT